MADQRRPKKMRVTTEAECGEKISAEAWRYDDKLFSQVYMQVKDAQGNWATFRVLVPRGALYGIREHFRHNTRRGKEAS